MVCHHVGRISACEAPELNTFVAALSYLLYKLKDQYAHFCMNSRKFCIGGKTKQRLFYFGEIGFHALPSRSCFLIQSKDQSHPLFGHKPFFLEGFHSIKSSDSGTFVIRGATAIDPPIYHTTFKGRIIPVCTRRHHIQMGQDPHGLVCPSCWISFLVDQITSEFNVAAVVVHIQSLKACLLSKIQHV